MNSLLSDGFKETQILIFKEMIGELRPQDASPYFEDFLPYETGEVFIDAGCYDFDTSLNFIRWCDGNYNKIIAFEPNPNQFPVCADMAKQYENSTVYEYGLWNESAELSFVNDGNVGSARISDDTDSTLKISTAKLDDILGGEKATFIKMDIEGAELNALKGAEQTILKYRPKLAISLYHKPEDIWEIPEYVLSLHGDYKLYLRHYSYAHYDTVLYAK